MLLGLLPGDCAVSPKSESVHFTHLDLVTFLTAGVASADFAVGDGLQLRVEAHAPGVYRLRCAPAKRFHDDKPSARVKARREMLLARQEPISELAVCSAIDAPSPCWRLEQGDVALELGQSAMQFALYHGDAPVLSLNNLSVSAATDHDEPQWQLQFALDTDDGLYGLGETSGELDRRGQQLVSDQPASRALPLVWSPLGWGVYVNTLGRVEHDLGADDSNYYTVTTRQLMLDIFVFCGDPSEIINQYTALTGRSGQPGLWPMGVWLDQAPGQSIAQTLLQARQLRDDGFAFDSVRLASPALYGFQADKTAFEWDSSRVTDARDLTSRFVALNVQYAAPSFPGVLADTGLFDEWEDRGWLLIDDETGGAHVFEGTSVTSGRPFGLLDLTHKDVLSLWTDRQKQVIDDGMGAPVCDAQFDIPDGITARGGETGAVLRTMYPLLARRALFQAVAGHKTPQEGVVCSTDLFPAVQRFAWQLGPQVTNDWAGFELSLRTALALGNSGVTAQMHNLGCAAQPTHGLTPELYIRWLAASVFSSNFSFQGLPALLPGAFDTATRELVQHWLRWRYRLIPYVLGIIEDAVRGGLPVQRSMAMAFPDDAVAHLWDTQYLLGPALLVAPVLQPGTQTKVYLPEGSAWWDLNTGWRYEGGTTWTVDAGLDTLPIFGREGHMLCLGPAAQHTGEFNSARILEEVWMFGMPEHSPVVMRNKIRVMQMQGSSYIKGLEGLRILPSEGLEVKRRGAEVRISRAR